MKKCKYFKKGGALIILGVLLLIVGLGFLFYIKLKIIQQRRHGIVLEQAFLESSKAARAKKTSRKEARTVEDIAVTQEDAIGVIRIDAINLVLPIYDDASSQKLLKGAGVVETTDPPSAKKNTITVLAGHRGSGSGLEYFLDIDELNRGDEVIITTRTETLIYSVTGKEVIEPDDWSKFVREANKNKLYLMSCHPYPINNKRLLVKTELINASTH